MLTPPIFHTTEVPSASTVAWAASARSVKTNGSIIKRNRAAKTIRLGKEIPSLVIQKESLQHDKRYTLLSRHCLHIPLILPSS